MKTNMLIVIILSLFIAFLVIILAIFLAFEAGKDHGMRNASLDYRAVEKMSFFDNGKYIGSMSGKDYWELVTAMAKHNEHSLEEKNK